MEDDLKLRAAGVNTSTMNGAAAASRRGARGSEGPTRATPHRAQPPGTETTLEANC